MSLRTSKISFLNKYFPPPKFMMMERVGLDISCNSVRFMEMLKTPQGIRPGRFGERKITEGVGYSEDVQNKKELKDILKKLKEEYNLGFVDVSLPEEKAYLFQTVLPPVEEDEIRNIIEISLEENVPLSGSEAVFDYTVINKDNKDGRITVGVSVIPKNVAESFVELFKSVDLMPVSFQLGAEAIARAVVKKEDTGTYMIVNLGEKKTGIYIVNQGLVHFTTTLNFGGEALTSGIEKLFNVSNEEALKIKKGKDFMKNKENMQVFFSLLNPISALKDEINRLYIYWNTHKNQNGQGDQVKKIILCGSDSNLHGLDEYLTLTLKTETEAANVWSNVFSFEEYVPELPFEDSLNYPAAIGLAL